MAPDPARSRRIKGRPAEGGAGPVTGCAGNERVGARAPLTSDKQDSERHPDQENAAMLCEAHPAMQPRSAASAGVWRAWACTRFAT